MTIQSFAGHVELNESYIGGVHKSKRGRGAGSKVVVLGILKRPRDLPRILHCADIEYLRVFLLITATFVQISAQLVSKCRSPFLTAGLLSAKQ